MNPGAIPVKGNWSQSKKKKKDKDEESRKSLGTSVQREGYDFGTVSPEDIPDWTLGQVGSFGKKSDEVTGVNGGVVGEPQEYIYPCKIDAPSVRKVVLIHIAPE